jgi:peptidoglycan/LPS O-acetylase OafA/YrhL
MSAPASLPKTDITPSRGLGYRPEVDGLRAFAIFAVIVNHFNKDLLPSGYLGVDIFFVISGYVITSALASRQSSSFIDFLSGFYTRRIKRLVPALATCVAITSILDCLFNPSPEMSLRTGIASLFGFSNLFLLKISTDYFGPSSELNAFTQTWSLGVEEQFYLLFPLLFWFTGFGRLTLKGSRNLFWVLGTLMLASLGGFIILNGTNQPAAYFLMPTRLWELGAGCLLFLRQNSLGTYLSALLAKIKPLLVFVALVVDLFFPLKLTVPATIAVVVLTVLLIASLRPGIVIYDLLTHPNMVYIGLISYSLYLWHWSVLSISQWTIGIHWWSAPIQVALMLLLAVASYQYVEKPLRHSEWSKYRWKSIVYGMSAMGGIAAILFAYLHTNPQRLFLQPSDKTFLNVGFENYPLFPVTKVPYTTCVVLYEEGRKYMADTFEKCTVPPSNGKTQMIYVLGDSHAGHFLGLFVALYKQSGVGFHLIETPGLPFPLSRNASKKTDLSPQVVARQDIFRKIYSRLSSGDIVVVSRLFYNREDKSLIDLSNWTSELQDLAKLLAKKDASLIIIGPPPIFQFPDIRMCSAAWYRSPDCSVIRDPISRKRSRVILEISSAIAHYSNAFVFDQFDYLCPKGSTMCSPSMDGVALFRDEDHLSAAGAEKLERPFESFLRHNKLLKK